MHPTVTRCYRLCVMQTQNHTESPIIKRKAGRPPRRWSAEVKDKVCRLISDGMSHAGAANACSISEAEFYRERDRDKVFDDAIRTADAASEEVLLGLAKEAARRDGRVAVMLLERRHSAWRRPAVVSGQVQHAHLHAAVPANLLTDMALQRKALDSKSRGNLENTGKQSELAVDCEVIVKEDSQDLGDDTNTDSN